MKDFIKSAAIAILFMCTLFLALIGAIVLYMRVEQGFILQPPVPIPAAQLYKLNDSTGVFTRVPGDKAVKQLQAGTYYIGTKNPEKP